MRKTWCSMFDSTNRDELIARVRRLTPDTSRRWGRMTAPQMIAHLTDQMSHCLGDYPCAPVKSFLRFAPIRFASIYLVP